MATVPFPITEDSFEGIRRQVYELLRNIYEEKIGGADLGDVFSLPGEVLTLEIADSSGLTKAGNELAVDYSSTGGLTITATGLATYLLATGGLESDATGLGINLDGTSLTLSAAGLRVTESQISVVTHTANEVFSSTDFLKLHIFDTDVGGNLSATLPQITAALSMIPIGLVRKGANRLTINTTGGDDMVLTAGRKIDNMEARLFSTMVLAAYETGYWGVASMRGAAPFGIWNVR